jgi:hypothetical protein
VSEYNVKHVSFGSKEDLSKDIIGLANNNVAEKAKGLAGISFEGTFDALNESNDNIRVAWKQVHPVQDIYKLMFAFYCQDQINAIDNDISLDDNTKKTLKNKYGEFFNNNLDGLSTLNQVENERKFKELIEADYKNNAINDVKDVRYESDFNKVAQEMLESLFSKAKTGKHIKHYMWMMSADENNRFTALMKNNIKTAIDKYADTHASMFSLSDDELKEKIRDFIKKAIENPNTIFAINSNTANEDLIDGTVVTPNKIISLFNSVLGKFANMPSNILFPKAWSDNSFLVAKELTKDMYEDFYGNDKEMNETVETNAIEEFNLSTTVQQREELVGLQKLIIKHLLYYIAKRDNRSAMNAFNDNKVKTEIRKAVTDIFQNNNIEEIFAIINRNRANSTDISNLINGKNKKISSHELADGLFDKNGRFVDYEDMSDIERKYKDFFLANTKKHLSDQKSAYNKQMIDESIQKIKDNLNVIIRLSMREIGNDLSIKTNFQAEKDNNKEDIDEDEMNHEKEAEAETEDSEGETDNDNTKEGDDETVKAVQNNNDGFGDNFTNDPRLSMSKEVRYILSNIIDVDFDGNGNIKPKNSNVFKYVKNIDYAFAYNLLMEMMVPMHSSNDMIAILNYNKEVYPWINQLLDMFEKKPDIKTAFYCTFAKSYNTFWTFHSKGTLNTINSNKDRFVERNHPQGIYNLIDKWRHVYENREILSPEYSIYEYDANQELILNHENAKKLKNLAYTLLRIKDLVAEKLKQKDNPGMATSKIYAAILSGDVYNLIQRQSDNEEIKERNKKRNGTNEKLEVEKPLTSSDLQIINIFSAIRDDINNDNDEYADFIVTNKDGEKINILDNILEYERKCLGAVAINTNTDVLKRIVGHYGLSYTKGSSKRSWKAQAEDVFSSIAGITETCAQSDSEKKIDSFSDYNTGEIVNKDLISTFGNYYRTIASVISKINNNTALLSSLNIDGKSYYAHNMETNIDEVLKVLTNSMGKYSFNGDQSKEAVREYNREMNDMFRQYEWFFTPERDANGVVKYDEETGAMKGTWKVEWLEMLDAENQPANFNSTAETNEQRLARVYAFQKRLRSFVLVKADETEYSKFSKPYHMKVLMKAFDNLSQLSDKGDQYATYPFFTLSDLGTEIYITGLKFQATKNGEANKECIAKFKRVAMQEIDRMAKVRALSKVNAEKLPDTYKEEGKHFCMLSGLRGEKYTREDGSIGYKTEDDIMDLYKLISQGTKSAEEYKNAVDNFNDRLDFYMEQYLNDKINNAYDEFIDIGMFDKDEKDRYEFIDGNTIPTVKTDLFKDAEKLLIDLISNNEYKNKLTDIDGKIDHSYNDLLNLMRYGQNSNRSVWIKHSKVQNLVNQINAKIGNVLDVKTFDIDRNNIVKRFDVLGDFILNSDFARTQMANIFCTDLAYYGGCMNFSKRVKGYQSPYSKMDIFAKYINGKGEIENIGRKYEKVVIMKDLKEPSELLSMKDKDGKQVNIIQSIFDKELNLRISRINNDKTLTDDQKKEYIDDARQEMSNISDMFKKMKVTDAAAYRTLESYRDIMIMMDNENWTKEAETAYQNIMDGKYTMKDFQVLLRQFKPFFNAPITMTIDGHKTRVPFQIKNSEQVMLAIFGVIAGKYDNKFKHLNEYMHERGIDSAVYESCVKVGFVKENEIDLHSMPNDISKDEFFKKLDNDLGMKIADSETDDVRKKYSFNDRAVYNVDLERFGDQTFTDDHLTDRRQSEGTQQKKLVFMDIPGDANFFIPGYENNGSPKAMKKEELLRLYNKLLSTKLMNALSKCDKTIGSVRALSEKMKSIIKTDTSWNIEDLNCFDVIRNEETGKDEFRLSILDPMQAKRIFAMISSIIKKNVLIYTNGGTLLNGCCIALSKENEPHIIMRKNKCNGEDEIEAVECWLPASSKAIFHQFAKKDENGKLVTDGEGNPVIEGMDINKIPVELRDMVGYRIPTEDKYSVLPLRIKGFLNPSEGNSILLPKEITTITGLDFDGDKFFLMIYAFIQKDGQLSKIKYNYNKEPWEQSDSAVSNAIIDLTRAVLTHESSAQKIFNPSNFNEEKRIAREITILKNFEEWYSDVSNHHLLLSDDKGTADNIFNELKSAIEDLGTTEDQKLNVVSRMIRTQIDQKHLNMSTERFLFKFEITSILSQIEMSFLNTNGKLMISAFSLGMSFHALLEETKIALKQQNVFRLCGHEGRYLNRVFDFRGKYISKTQAENLGAGADTAEDPCLAELNVNEVTVYVFVLLETFGFSTEEVSLFLNQPLVEKIVGLMMESKFNNIQDMAIKAVNLFVFENAAYIHDLSEDEINEYLKEIHKEVLNYQSCVTGEAILDFDKAFLMRSIKVGFCGFHVSSKNFILENYRRDYDDYCKQIKVASLFVYLMDMATGFKQVMSLMRADTTSGASGQTIGNSLRKIRAISRFEKGKYYQMFFQDEESKRLLRCFDVKYKNNEVDVKSTMEKNSIGENPNDILITSRTVGLMPITQTVGYNIFFTNSFMNILDEISVYTKQSDSVLSEETLNRVVDDFKTYWLSDAEIFETKPDFINMFVEQYKNFKESHLDLFSQYLVLQRLQYVGKSRMIDFPIISFKNFGDLSIEYQRKMTRELLYMFESNDMAVGSFVRSMFIYAYVKDALDFSKTSYAQLFPSSMKINLGDYRNKINSLTIDGLKNQDIRNFSSQFVLNHLNDLKSQFLTRIYSRNVVSQFLLKQILKNYREEFIEYYIPLETVTIGISQDVNLDLFHSLFVKNIITENDSNTYIFKSYISIMIDGYSFYYECVTPTSNVEEVTYHLIKPLGCKLGLFKEYSRLNSNISSRFINNDYNDAIKRIREEIEKMDKKSLKRNRWNLWLGNF